MSIYDFTVKNRDGEEISLSKFQGKVLLIVNTATGCGFTPQYEGLEYLYDTYHEAGLEILDFPCNQFGHQAPGDDSEIHDFCVSHYYTEFDQLKKIDVNGEFEDSLYTYLKKEMPHEKVVGLKNKMAMKAIMKMSSTCKHEGDIAWNFTKFLVDRNGKVVKRFSPTFSPRDMESFVKELISV